MMGMKRIFGKSKHQGSGSNIQRQWTFAYDGIGELKGHRFHLRVDHEEKGVLIVDASKLIFLNGSALDYIRCLLQGKDQKKTIRFMRKRYRNLKKDTAVEHYLKLKDQLLTYLKGNESVIQNIGTDNLSIGSDLVPAPYRMDLVLTYACQNECKHCYNENGRRSEDGTSYKTKLKSSDPKCEDEGLMNTESKELGSQETVSNEDRMINSGSKITESNDIGLLEIGTNEDRMINSGSKITESNTIGTLEIGTNEDNVCNSGSEKTECKEVVSLETGLKETGKEELTLEQWKEVLNRLWKIGIPHIVFTGGEATLSPHLKELISRSEELGQITGLITNGRKLKYPGYLKVLVDAGLDHVQITLLSHRESVHDELTGMNGSWEETVEGIKTAVNEDIYTVTNTTIMQSTLSEIEDTMHFLVKLGVKNIAFNSIIRSGKGKTVEGVSYEDLKSTMIRLKSIGLAHGIKLTWYTPTPYCEFNPVNYGLGIKQCTACSLNMAIEPDGSVLPCQSYYQPLGNILVDQWDSIWEHSLCREIRERGYIPDKCKDCDLMHVCGGGCPLSIKHGDYLCLDRSSSR